MGVLCFVHSFPSTESYLLVSLENDHISLEWNQMDRFQEGVYNIQRKRIEENQWNNISTINPLEDVSVYRYEDETILESWIYQYRVVLMDHEKKALSKTGVDIAHIKSRSDLELIVKEGILTIGSSIDFTGNETLSLYNHSGDLIVESKKNPTKNGRILYDLSATWDGLFYVLLKSPTGRTNIGSFKFVHD